MKEDQEVLLQQQREAIVQQVMQSLRESGVVLSPDRGVSKQITHRKAGSGSPTCRLEQNLRLLVLHSLSESGLDFPHVQRAAYVHPRDGNANKAMNSRANPQQSQGKTIIVARQEGANNFSDDHPTEPRSDIIDAKRINGSTAHRSRGKRKPLQNVSMLQESPLGALRHRRTDKQRTARSESSQHARKPAQHEDNGGFNEYADAVDPVDAEFNRTRNKVGHKTLAVLEKTKSLLNQNKKAKLLVDKGSGKTFVARMREIQADANSSLATESKVQVENHHVATQSTSPSVGKTRGKEVDDLKAKPGAKSNSEIAPSSDADDSECVQQSTQDSDVNAPKSTARKDLASIRCDVGLLRPPERSPENETERDNELARQILTIYTTSVKAKAAGLGNGDAKSSNGTDGRLTNRPSRSSPAPECKYAAREHNKGRSLGSSCSLPAIDSRAGSAVAESRHHRSTASVHYSREPSERLENGKVVISVPKVPRPIWFAGTGAVKAVWCTLAQGFTSDLQSQQQYGQGKASSPGELPKTSPITMCEHRLCEEVRRMEAKQQFGQCITTLESLLITLVRARGIADLEAKLWKQLVVTCNAFASRCIDYKKFTPALQLIKQAEQLIYNSILVDEATRLELMAYLYDTYAHYYYRKRKAHAGLQYILKVHEIHSKQSNWSHLAKCRLHIANLLSFQLKHQEAMKYMASILEMIEENKLEEQGNERQGGDSASGQKICLVAVCYNNLAVEQLHLREFEAASVSSANAKHLARLCLSYSNRWLAQFEATSNCAALAVATLMEDANAAKPVLLNNGTPQLTE